MEAIASVLSWLQGRPSTLQQVPFDPLAARRTSSGQQLHPLRMWLAEFVGRISHQWPGRVKTATSQFLLFLSSELFSFLQCFHCLSIGHSKLSFRYQEESGCSRQLHTRVLEGSVVSWGTDFVQVSNTLVSTPPCSPAIRKIPVKDPPSLIFINLCCDKCPLCKACFLIADHLHIRTILRCMETCSRQC